MSLNIASWNVNSLNVRLPHVLAWLEKHPVDVLCLQEIKMPSELFPHEAFQSIGYHAVVSGQKTYNGVAVISRLPMSDPVTEMSDFFDLQRRMVSVTVNDVRVCSVYVPNGESVTSDKYQYKLSWLEAFLRYVQLEKEQFGRVVILGDFNIAPSDEDVHDPVKWLGSVLCSEKERFLFRDLLALGFFDCFRSLHRDEKRFTWWDYRLNAFKRNMGLRIDHILCSEGLLPLLQHVEIDSEERALERPSDHAPIRACFK